MNTTRHTDRVGRSLGLALGLGLTCWLVAGAAATQDTPDHVHHASHATTGASGTAEPDAGHAHHDHSAHRTAMERTGYTRSTTTLQLPDIELVNSLGERVSTDALLNPDHPILVNFIFTSCATICPVMSASFYQARHGLDGDSGDVGWVSISIDPEYDTPERLRDYAARFQAGPDWIFVTGDIERIIALQKAFDVYRGGKMNHMPVTFLRPGHDRPWVRLDGLASGSELITEYHRLTSR